MSVSGYSFELLNHVWLEGDCPYYFDGDGHPLRFPSLEDALAELQDDFDTWAREMEDGEREPDCGFSPEEFEIRCVETDERFGVDLTDGKLRIGSSQVRPE